MTSKRQTPAITKDPNIQGGVPVFTGTRVTVDVMLDYLEDGQPLERFLDLYPQISREQAVAALEEIKTMLAMSA
jgi:uncharacterized protein (DUF433 family)